MYHNYQFDRDLSSPFLFRQCLAETIHYNDTQWYNDTVILYNGTSKIKQSSYSDIKALLKWYNDTSQCCVRIKQRSVISLPIQTTPSCVENIRLFLLKLSNSPLPLPYPLYSQKVSDRTVNHTLLLCSEYPLCPAKVPPCPKPCFSFSLELATSLQTEVRICKLYRHKNIHVYLPLSKHTTHCHIQCTVSLYS